MKEKDTTKKQQKQQDQVTKFRDKNLSYKISVAVSLLLVICLTVMIAISATIAGKSLSNTVSGEFEGIATENGLKVQAVIDTAANMLIMKRTVTAEMLRKVLYMILICRK